jgi:hypothetical protein
MLAQSQKQDGDMKRIEDGGSHDGPVVRCGVFGFHEDTSRYNTVDSTSRSLPLVPRRPSLQNFRSGLRNRNRNRNRNRFQVEVTTTEY